MSSTITATARPTPCCPRWWRRRPPPTRLHAGVASHLGRIVDRRGVPCLDGVAVEVDRREGGRAVGADRRAGGIERIGRGGHVLATANLRQCALDGRDVGRVRDRALLHVEDQLAREAGELGEVGDEEGVRPLGFDAGDGEVVIGAARRASAPAPRRR